MIGLESDSMAQSIFSLCSEYALFKIIVCTISLIRVSLMTLVYIIN